MNCFSFQTISFCKNRSEFRCYDDKSNVQFFPCSHYYTVKDRVPTADNISAYLLELDQSFEMRGKCQKNINVSTVRNDLIGKEESY